MINACTCPFFTLKKSKPFHTYVFRRVIRIKFVLRVSVLNWSIQLLYLHPAMLSRLTTNHPARLRTDRSKVWIPAGLIMWWMWVQDFLILTLLMRQHHPSLKPSLCWGICIPSATPFPPFVISPEISYLRARAEWMQNVHIQQAQPILISTNTSLPSINSISKTYHK